MAAKKQKPKKNTASAGKRKTPVKTYAQPGMDNRVDEPAVEYTTKIRAIGNSKGLILNNQLMDLAGLVPEEDVVIRAINGLITIKQAEKPVINTDRSTWEKQFKAAIKAGHLPEGDMWKGMENEFDRREW